MFVRVCLFNVPMTDWQTSFWGVPNYPHYFVKFDAQALQKTNLVFEINSVASHNNNMLLESSEIQALSDSQW